MALTTDQVSPTANDVAYADNSAMGKPTAQQNDIPDYPGSVPGRPQGSLALDSTSSTQFGTAPDGFASKVDPIVQQLATDMGIDMNGPNADQDVYNLLALMRVSGGQDGFFGSGDVVAGAMTLGMQLNDNAIGALQKFSKANMADGDLHPNSGKMTMKDALAINEKTLQGWGASPEIMALKPGSNAVKGFQENVHKLASAISEGEVQQLLTETPWLSTINLMELGFDWQHLGIDPPNDDAKKRGNQQIDAANSAASAGGYAAGVTTADANAMQSQPM